MHKSLVASAMQKCYESQDKQPCPVYRQKVQKVTAKKEVNSNSTEHQGIDGLT